MKPVEAGSGSHICLRAKSTGEVDAFHAAALKSGGSPTARLACARMTA